MAKDNAGSASVICIKLTATQTTLVFELAQAGGCSIDAITDLALVYGLNAMSVDPSVLVANDTGAGAGVASSLAEKYPQYHKSVQGLDSIDVYTILDLFKVHDHTLGHAIKKLLLAGVRTGTKSKADDVREARDTLNRWAELQEKKK